MKKTLKIRHYVMGLALQAGNSSIKLPPLRELEAMLDVSRGTLVAAFKELAGDGYLSARNGIGYFTRPAMLNVPFQAPSPRMLGYIAGDGKNFYFSGNTFFLAPDLFREFRDRNWRLHFRNLEGHTGDELLREILAWGCDAILWHRPEPAQFPLMGKLLAAGVPLLSTHRHFPLVSSVSLELSAPHVRIGSEFARRGWRRILIASRDAMPFREDLEKGAAQAGGAVDIHFLDTGCDGAAELLEKTLETFNGEAVVCDERSGCLVRRFRERNHRSFHVLNQLQYLGDDGKIYSYVPDFAENARCCARELEALMNGVSEMRYIAVGGDFVEWHGENMFTL